MEASASAEPKNAPVHGPTPTANTMPNKNADHAPSTLYDFFNPLKNGKPKSPIYDNPKIMTIAPATILITVLYLFI